MALPITQRKKTVWCRSSTQPPTVACKTEAQSEYVHVACTLFARLDADLHAQSVISNKNFCVGAQSEAY